MAKKYVVVEVCEREISTPRFYDSFEEANGDLYDSFAQVKGYDNWEKFAADYPEAEEDDFSGDNFGISNDVAWAETANHDNWDIEIFAVEV